MEALDQARRAYAGSALTSSAVAYGSIELLVGANVEWQGRSLRLNAEGKPALAVQPVEVGQSWIGGITHGPDGEAIVVGTKTPPLEQAGVRP